MIFILYLQYLFQVIFNLCQKVFYMYCFFLAFNAFCQSNPQSKTITEKFFPDFKEIENCTPTLKKKNGFTNDTELYNFLESAVKNHPQKVKLEFIGTSQEGRQIPIIFLSNSYKKENLKIWFQGGLHGNEPASTEGMLYLIYNLLNDKKYNSLLDNVTLAIIPMANIDGYLNQNRYASNEIDLNRDQTKLIAKETIILKQAFSKFNPEIAVDFHEFRPFRKNFFKLKKFGIAAYYDVMFLYSGNLNIPENLRNITKDIFIKNAKKSLRNYQLTHQLYLSPKKSKDKLHFYQGSVNSRSSATNFALTNAISSLIEIRGIGLGKTSFKRRIFSTFVVAISYIKSAIRNKQLIQTVIKKATNSNGKIVVTHRRKTYKDSIKVIDLDTEELIYLPIIKKDALKATPKLTRKKPLAYLIHSDESSLIKKNRITGY